MDKFLTVAQQVLILFILIGVGFVCGRKKILTEQAVKSCAELVLLFATPCVIVDSFIKNRHPSMLAALGKVALAALVVHIIGITAAYLFFRKGDAVRKNVLRFGTVFSNAGYMCIPLQQAVLGDEGVMYGAAFVAVFNIVMWSYGLVEMSGSTRSFSVRKLILNPGIIGLAAGLVIFFLPVSMPVLITAPISHLAAINTPIPMLIIGYYLANTRLSAALRDKSCYQVAVLRLVVLPLACLGVLYLGGMRGNILVACIIAASAPCAAATTMFAARYDRDTILSVNLVSMTTLFSMLTMPLIVALAQMLPV